MWNRGSTLVATAAALFSLEMWSACSSSHGTGGSSGDASAGAAGSSGNAGASGSAGAGGSAGSAGAGGSAGSAGAGGSAGSAGAGGSAGSAGAGGSAGSAGAGGSAGSAGTGGSGGSVLEYHNSPTRDGLYVDPLITKNKAKTTHRDATFNASLNGPTYAQPLYFAGGPGGKDLVIVSTEQNDVTAFDAADGSVVWQKHLATPVPRNRLPCGNIDPLGITGAGVIDPATRRLFVDAMTTPDGGTTKKHMVYALSINTGAVVSGWPVDISAKVKDGNLAFDSSVQNERGALTIMNGTVYVPYGGHYGDCGTYHGWVVGIPMNNPGAPKGWATRAVGGGIWSPVGVSSDGTSLFVATGNTFGATNWSDGEAVIRLGAGPAYSQQPADYFAPSDWQSLDGSDTDIGSSGAVLVDAPGATPSKLAVAMGKNGVAYLLNRNNLGGIGTGDGTTGEGVASARVANGTLIQGEIAYTTSQGTYIVFNGSVINCPGSNGDLGALRISKTSPPQISVAWCANEGGGGSPIVTTTNGQANAVVWGLGAGSSDRLTAFDGDTGQVLFDGTGAQNTMQNLRRYQTPIAAKGRIFVAGDDTLYAFTTQ